MTFPAISWRIIPSTSSKWVSIGLVNPIYKPFKLVWKGSHNPQVYREQQRLVGISSSKLVHHQPVFTQLLAAPLLLGRAQLDAWELFRAGLWGREGRGKPNSAVGVWCENLGEQPKMAGNRKIPPFLVGNIYIYTSSKSSIFQLPS